VRLALAMMLLGSAGLPVAAATLGGDIAGGDALLPAHEAFVLAARRPRAAMLVLRWRIADGYYLYRARMHFSLHHAGRAHLGKPRFGPAQMEDDPILGRTAIYRDQARVRLALHGTPAPGATLRVRYQGCNAPQGVCYPPIERDIALATLEPARPEPTQ